MPALEKLLDHSDPKTVEDARAAIDAIKSHLDEVLATGGEQQVRERWERIWTGYRALAPPSGVLNRWRMRRSVSRAN